ncbi:MAG: DUF692 domain-containing protein [Deltaproteobacteria bacterium]|jgi:uncharacterized protein (UPF0276 family)|nr:DUF692 domain-containing protein [Deltaproteobacteria bacterium]MBW2500445.1 DUF692 domain-containing protein [Deltaproteobacteria bacterium]
MALLPRPTGTIARIEGAGLGLRRAFLGSVVDQVPDAVHFFEVAPENWIDVGGRLGRQLRSLTERVPFVCHGLSLSLGGPAPLDEELLCETRDFLDHHDIRCFSEHLSYSGDSGHLYDLLPIPFTEEAVRWVSGRIRHAQEILERPIAIENVSYYAAPGQSMTEVEFLLAVLEEADCHLLLDVNNVYVNAVNHAYDPHDFIAGMPAERIAYLHVAGHYREQEDLLVDTHGAAVVDSVWDLLEATYRRFGPLPTLLERDFNIPPLPEMLREVDRISALMNTRRMRDACEIRIPRAVDARGETDRLRIAPA